MPLYSSIFVFVRMHLLDSSYCIIHDSYQRPALYEVKSKYYSRLPRHHSLFKLIYFMVQWLLESREEIHPPVDGFVQDCGNSNALLLWYFTS